MASPAPAAATAPVDALQYAETLRKNLMQELFDGEEGNDAAAEEEEDGDFSIEVGTAAGTLSLADLDKQIEEYQEHEIIKAILDRGMVIKEYATDVDNKLRQVELESIQDYIQESDNLVGLHEQVGRGGKNWQPHRPPGRPAARRRARRAACMPRRSTNRPSSSSPRPRPLPPTHTHTPTPPHAHPHASQGAQPLD